MGISEHFEFQFKQPITQTKTKGEAADYLYLPGAGVLDQGQGLWGILRGYNAGGDPNTVPFLKPLPNNPGGGVLLKGNASCPTNSLGSRTYNVAAIYLKDGLTYNSRDESNATVGSIGNQSGALVYVPSDASGNPIGPIPPKDPLVLRAAAGECITVNLFNKIK